MQWQYVLVWQDNNSLSCPVPITFL